MTTLAVAEAPPRQFQPINLTGRLTSDPELRTARTDRIVGGLRLAIQRPRKNGEDSDVDYVDVTVFGREAETCAKCLAKGRRVGVSGRLQDSEWNGENGRGRSSR